MTKDCTLAAIKQMNILHHPLVIIMDEFKLPDILFSSMHAKICLYVRVIHSLYSWVKGSTSSTFMLNALGLFEAIFGALPY